MGNFCKSHPCDTEMYRTGVMNLEVVCRHHVSNCEISQGPDHQYKPPGCRCMQADIAYRRKLQALLAVGL